MTIALHSLKVALRWRRNFFTIEKTAQFFTQKGLQQVTYSPTVTAPKPASDATFQFLLFSCRNRILTVRNPIAPASYSPTNPYARIVPTSKSRGSEQRGGNASEDMLARMCNDLPWLRLGGLVEQEARGGRGSSDNTV